MFSFNEIKNSKGLAFEFLDKLCGENAQGSCGLLCVFKNNNDDKNRTIISPTNQQKPVVENWTQHSRDMLIESKTNVVLYKFGNTGYNCTLSRTEFIISSELAAKCNHLPYFERPFFYMKNYVVSNNTNPFHLDSMKNASCVDVVIFEYIQHAFSFYKMIKSDAFSQEAILSVFTQVILCIVCAQQNCDFVHNDLHTDNILIVECDKNLVIKFRLMLNGKEREFYVPTYGFIPVIIDYGFAYSKECENMSLESADFDQHGLITYQFDAISDFVRFFSAFVKDFNNSEVVEFVNELFCNLPINTKKGFETLKKRSSTEFCENAFLKTYEEVFGKSKKQWTYIQQISKLLMRIIILPLKHNSNTNNSNYFKWLKIFWKEWYEIDKWCVHEFQRIFIFRELIDTIRKTTNAQHVKKRVNDCFEEIMPENVVISLNVDFEKFIKSILAVARITENHIYKNTKRLNKQRHEILYSKLVSGENMVEKMLDVIYKVDKLIPSGSVVFLVDNINKENAIQELSENLQLHTVSTLPA